MGSITSWLDWAEAEAERRWCRCAWLGEAVSTIYCIYHIYYLLYQLSTVYLFYLKWHHLSSTLAPPPGCRIRGRKTRESSPWGTRTWTRR